MTPDPLTVASRYGLPWGICAGLSFMLWWVVTHWTPPHVWERMCAEKDELQKAVGTLVGDVRSLLELSRRRG